MEKHNSIAFRTKTTAKFFTNKRADRVRPELSLPSPCRHGLLSSSSSYQQGEDDGSRGHLDEAEHDEAEDLDQGEEVHLAQGDVPQVDVVRLALP